MIGPIGLRTPWEGDSSDTLPVYLRGKKQCWVSPSGSRGLGKLTPSCSLPRAVALYDSSLLIVVLQHAWHNVTWGCFLKKQSPESYSLDSVGQS